MIKAITEAANVLRPYLGWIIAAAVVAVLLLCIIFFVCHNILRKRHHRALEAEARAEENTLPASVLNAEVTVIPQEALPQAAECIFMPVPKEVFARADFITEAKDGVALRSCVRAEDADALMSDAAAVKLRVYIDRGRVAMDDCAYVSVDTLSDHFAPYSYVNLTILRAQGLVEDAMTALSIRADGVLRKPLLIEANEFSLTAVKMIALTGGRAVEARDTVKRAL